MDLLLLARSARTTLRVCLDTARACLELGQEIPQQVKDLAEQSLSLLDFYLTEKNGENQNNRRAGELDYVWECRDAHVHLSDGGYSRLTLSLVGGPNGEVVLFFCYSLSLPRATERWDALSRPDPQPLPLDEGEG